MSLISRLYLNRQRGLLAKVFTPVTRDFSYNYGNTIIQTIQNSHIVESYGWAISERPVDELQTGRRIVISGDTRPDAVMLKAAYRADLLVHEATYLRSEAHTAYLNGHSTAAEAAELAVNARVGALALTHIPSHTSRLEVQEEAQTNFSQVLVPAALETIHLGLQLQGQIREKAGWAEISVESGPVFTK